MQAPPPLNLSGHALFLDFDGTLAPLQDDPASVVISTVQQATLVKVSAAMGGALAIISGRDIEDLSLRVPTDLLRIGGHGLDVAQPGETALRSPGLPPASLASAVARAVAGLSQVWVEPKGRVLAVHYRANPDVAGDLHAKLATIIADHSEYSLQAGKMVFEAKPASANKGTALAAAMLASPFAGRTPVLIGDDKTDEDAIRSAITLGGHGVKVGTGESAAEWRLPDTAAVWNWLETAK